MSMDLAMSIQLRGILALLVAGVLFMLCAGSVQGVDAAPPGFFQMVHANLDDDASLWGIYQDGGNVSGSLTNTFAPSLDGTALLISKGGGHPYSGLHAYRNLPPTSDTQFTLSLTFRFTNLAAVQALEFTMSRWSNGQRWEWAVQWEHIGDGTELQGMPPTWRIWNGSMWWPIQLNQQLAADTWHTLTLHGEIFQGNVYYTSFNCDTEAIALSEMFQPVVASGEKLTVGAQLDGNGAQDPYQLTLDNVTLITTPGLLSQFSRT